MATTNLLGPAAAFGASVTWAYASTRYARISRQVGSARVNLARAAAVLPIYGLAVPALHGTKAFAGVTAGNVVWLVISVLSSYAIADSVFFTAARRIGITTALAIASSYPLWAALWGALVSHESFGAARAGGTVLCVLGVIWLVRLARPAEEAGVTPGHARTGLLLAFATSLFWAANSVSVKRGAQGIDVWQANLIRYSVAFVLLAPQATLGRARQLAVAPVGGWVPVLPAIFADAFAGSLFYVYGLAHTDLAVGSTLSSLAPLVSVPFALALGEERWSPRRFAAVLMTVAGVVVLVVGGPGSG